MNIQEKADQAYKEYAEKKKVRTDKQIERENKTLAIKIEQQEQQFNTFFEKGILQGIKSIYGGYWQTSPWYDHPLLVFNVKSTLVFLVLSGQNWIWKQHPNYDITLSSTNHLLIKIGCLQNEGVDNDES